MKVLIADDHALFRDGLSLHLEQRPSGGYFSGREFFAGHEDY